MDVDARDSGPEELNKALSERDDEIRRLRLALDVLSPIDPSSGTLNRNGLIDAIQDALNWLARRKDQFGVLLIEVKGLPEPSSDAGDAHHWLAKHLEAVMSATLRGVDKIGQLDHLVYVAVLREFKVAGVKVSFCCNNCKGKAEKMTGNDQLVALIGDKAFKKGGFKVGKDKE